MSDNPNHPQSPSQPLLNEQAGPWYRGITRYQWLVLTIASLGWVFDVYEGQIFVSTMREMMDQFLGSDATEGDKNFFKNVCLAAFLLGGALGGVFFGMVSDRIGRSKTMVLTILMYSCFTCVSAFAQTWWQMAILRFLVAMGVGGEWAVASAMVAEVFPKRARAWSAAIFHASSIFGTYLAALAGMLIAAGASWRVAFVLGILPALLTLWIRWRLREPDKWVEAQKTAEKDKSKRTGRILDLFTRENLRGTIVGVSLAAIGLATFWGVHIYGKNLMRRAAEQRILAEANITSQSSEDDRKAVLKDNSSTLKNMEMVGILLGATGGGFGLLCFGAFAEWIGRRGAFLFYHLGGLVAALLLFRVFGNASEGVLLVALPIFGFLTLGMHAGYAIYFPELFPTRLRGTGGGFCFNFGRIIAAPILIIGGLMQKDWGFTLEGTASILSLLYLLALVVLLFAPETKGRELPT